MSSNSDEHQSKNTTLNSSTNLLSAALGSAPAMGLQFPTFSFKLDRNNYSIWRSNVLDALEAFELKDFVISNSAPATTVTTAATGTTPVMTSPNPNHALWIRKGKFVLVWMRTTISVGLHVYIKKATTSRAAWLVLEAMFQQTSLARAMDMKAQLHTLTKGSSSILEYFEKKQDLADDLATCNQPVSDNEFVACVLQGLDPSYGPFRAAFNMRFDSISASALLGHLLREEERLL